MSKLSNMLYKYFSKITLTHLLYFYVVISDEVIFKINFKEFLLVLQNNKLVKQVWNDDIKMKRF